jgi:hypothetical protein
MTSDKPLDLARLPGASIGAEEAPQLKILEGWLVKAWRSTLSGTGSARGPDHRWTLCGTSTRRRAVPEDRPVTL